MTTPEQRPAHDPDPLDDADECLPGTGEMGDETGEPEPDTGQPVETPLADADLPPGELALEPDEEMIPESDRPPRIVQETPVGGRLPLEPAPPADAGEPLRDMPAPEAIDAAQPEPETPLAPEHELAPSPPPDEATPPEPEAAPGPPAEVKPVPAAPDEQMTAPGPESAIAEAAAETGTETIAPAEPEAGAAVEEGEAEAEAPVETAPEAEAPALAEAAPEAESAPSPAPTAPEPSTVRVTRPEDWDEELSPELAAILFGAAARAEPAEVAAPAEAAPSVAPEAVPEAAPAPAVEAAAPAPITSREDARTRPIAAGQFTAPAPDASVEGTVRYIRVEEPLGGDSGRRIRESWEFFGPDYPALEGRLVKRIQSEEIAYADGSWKFTFRRDYSEGRDERTVRIARDGEFIERTDRVRRKNALTGKTVRAETREALAFAPPKHEEKRGFLGRLFGRGGDSVRPEGPKQWRPATDAEQREAYRRGGEAFRLGIFERP